VASASDRLFHQHGILNRGLFVPELHAALDASARIAAETGWDNLRTPHLFMGLLSAPDETMHTWAKVTGIAKLEDLLKQFETMFRLNVGPYITHLQLHREFCSDNFISLLRRSLLHAIQQGREQVKTFDLLVEIFQNPNSIVAECFRRTGISPQELIKSVHETEELLSNASEKST
jgi:ATP-dependent Clp protease ATP-binding subunit ClpA